ncbi:MAG: polysaccharide deacetylase family protein [Bacilli bacterium]|nr:polysaccharide deacetylase family protein [Bacilli bacterium]
MSKGNKYLFITILLVIIYLLINIFVPKVELIGKDDITMSVGTKFKDPGVKAYFRLNDVSNSVQEKSNLKTKKIGHYYIDYYIKRGPFKIKKRRHIEVVDDIKPKIIIKNKYNNYYVCPNKELDKVAYEAKDNYDGDITDDVKVDIHKDKVIFTVSDKSKNKTTVTKKIMYVDVERPSLKLNEGDKTIFLGDKYEEPFAEAKDNCDGNISKNIKINGKVDNKKTGKYELIYEISDKAGNKNSKKRVVTVKEKPTGTIYLTFDDGPNSGTTDVILNILKEEGVKATFFVTCKGPDDLIKREFKEGHTVALHTASHDYSYIYASEENYLADLKRVSDRVERITGKKTMYVRFPGGASNTISRRYSPGIMTRLSNKISSMGYRFYDWNISSGDAEAGSHTAGEISSNVINSIRPNGYNIVLMHDIKPYTRDGLRDIIKWGKSNGYRFLPIDDNTHQYHQRINN